MNPIPSLMTTQLIIPDMTIIVRHDLSHDDCVDPKTNELITYNRMTNNCLPKTNDFMTDDQCSLML